MAKKEVKAGDIVLCDVKDEVLAGAEDPREVLPAQDRFHPMLVLGPTGCGKTTRMILPMVQQDLQNPNCGVTVLELRGNLAVKAYTMAKHYGRDAVLFDPTYKNCPKFNPLVGREVEVVEKITTTFRMLNPDSPQFWLDLNDLTISNGIKVLKRLDYAEKVDGKYATLINLNRLLENLAGQGREMVNKFVCIRSRNDSEAKENVDIASWFLNEYFPEGSKAYESTSCIRAQIAKLVSNEYLRDILNPNYEKGEQSEVDFDRYLQNGTVFCAATQWGKLHQLYKPLGHLIVLSLQAAIRRRPGLEDARLPHALYIDEFEDFAMHDIADMLTDSYSYRVACVLTMQARCQMAPCCGREGKSFMEMVSTVSKNVVLFHDLNKDDVRYYSEHFGENAPNFADLNRDEVVYRIVKDNSEQPAKVGQVSGIPQDLDEKLNAAVQEYKDFYEI